MALLDLAPGPRVGEVLRALNEAVALDEIRNKEEARAFVLRLSERASLR